MANNAHIQGKGDIFMLFGWITAINR